MIQKIKETVTRDIEVEYPLNQNDKLESYIGLYDLGDTETCQNLINMVDNLWDKKAEDPNWNDSGQIDFEDPSNHGLSKDRRDDRALFISNGDYNSDTRKLQGWLQIAYDAYVSKYAIEHEMTSYVSKFHQAEAYSSGYAALHYEQAGGNSSKRNITWIVYLNDITDGSGCTEFPTYGIKSPPKAGRVGLFPAAYTHYHRGNIPYTRKSYATGWFECV
jgi:hypothetical protein